MANTWTKKALGLASNVQPALSLITRDYPVAAGQTFRGGWPVKNSSGLCAEWVSHDDALLLGFSGELADNLAPTVAGTLFPVILAEPDKLVVFANLLVTSTYATNQLAAADLFGFFTLEKGANLLGTGVPGWFAGDEPTDAMLKMMAFESDFQLPNVKETRPAAGDNDARCKFFLVPTNTVWGVQTDTGVL